jgi:hypothetical protein
MYFTILHVFRQTGGGGLHLEENRIVVLDEFGFNPVFEVNGEIIETFEFLPVFWQQWCLGSIAKGCVLLVPMIRDLF